MEEIGHGERSQPCFPEEPQRTQAGSRVSLAPRDPVLVTRAGRGRWGLFGHQARNCWFSQLKGPLPAACPSWWAASRLLEFIGKVNPIDLQASLFGPKQSRLSQCVYLSYLSLVSSMGGDLLPQNRANGPGSQGRGMTLKRPLESNISGNLV